MSTRTAPFAAPPSVPSGPSVTERTSAGYPTIVKITSDASATSPRDFASFAPLSTSDWAFAGVRL